MRWDDLTAFNSLDNSPIVEVLCGWTRLHGVFGMDLCVEPRVVIRISWQPWYEFPARTYLPIA